MVGRDVVQQPLRLVLDCGRFGRGLQRVAVEGVLHRCRRMIEAHRAMSLRTMLPLLRCITSLGRHSANSLWNGGLTNTVRGVRMPSRSDMLSTSYIYII